MSSLSKVSNKNFLCSKFLDKSPSISPESIKKHDDILDYELYEEKPDFKLILQKVPSKESKVETPLNSNDDLLYENHKENQEPKSKEQSSGFQTSSQELMFLNDNQKNLTEIEADKVLQDKLKSSVYKSTRARTSEIIEHFKNLEKRNGEEDEIESIQKGTILKRIIKKRKTKYRDHIEYKKLWLFLPDDYLKQRWDILILL